MIHAHGREALSTACRLLAAKTKPAAMLLRMSCLKTGRPGALPRGAGQFVRPSGPARAGCGKLPLALHPSKMMPQADGAGTNRHGHQVRHALLGEQRSRLSGEIDGSAARPQLSTPREAWLVSLFSCKPESLPQVQPLCWQLSNSIRGPADTKARERHGKATPVSCLRPKWSGVRGARRLAALTLPPEG
jgi:hypothetical protein